MTTVFILSATLMMIECALLCGLLAIARWSDRQLAMAWQEWHQTEFVAKAKSE